MLALTLALALAATPGDVVELKDGSKVEGRVVYDGPKRVVVLNGSREREIERSKVASVKSAANDLAAVLAEVPRIGLEDTAKLLELASRCRALGLEGEAKLLAYSVLGIDPASAAAHELCGHEMRGEKWTVREDGKKFTFDKLQEVRKDFGNAWIFHTTHFELRTNLPLRRASAIALELELHYRAFFDAIGRELELYEVVEPMKAQVHAESGSYPEVSSRTGYFSAGDNTLYVLEQGGATAGVIAHEATHQMLYNTAVKTKGGRGAIPQWFNEGFAEYMAASRSGAEGRASYSLGARHERHFAVHRDAKKPYDFSRVLTFEAEDFSASSKADLKYAQAYTLVHFCLHGQGELHRRGFFEFLRGAYLGRSSMTDFKDALAIKEREFEPTWHEYVRR
jgi:PAS domain-containing protein